MRFFKKNILLFQVFLLIILNYYITNHIYGILQLDEIAYRNRSIFYNLYEHLSTSLILVFLLPLVLYKLKWEDIFDKKIKQLKYFFIFIFLIYSWGILTLDYNLYFNQSYQYDRLFLLLLVFFSFRFPISFVYFFILSLLFFNQVMYPAFSGIDLSVYINIKPMNEALILFIIFIFLKSFYKNISILAVFIVVLLFHGANYYDPGLGKILISKHYIDWIWVNDLSDILIAKYSHGWLLSNIPLDSMLVIVKWLSIFAIPSQIFTFLIQIIVLFLFIHKRFSLFLFASFELLHFGIFLASGILFWKWILLNLGIVYVIQKLNRKNIDTIFNYKTTLFALPFLLLGHGVFKAHKLAWYDTPLNNYNKVYAITTKNQRYSIDANLFHLYKFAWYDGLLNDFNCFLNKPVRRAWDTLNQEETEELKRLSHQQNITNLKNKIYTFEQKYGKNPFNLKKQKKVSEFLRTYCKNLNNYQNKIIIWNYFTPPRHMYRSFDWDNALYRRGEIKEIEIVFSKKFYSHYYNRLITLETKSIFIKI